MSVGDLAKQLRQDRDAVESNVDQLDAVGLVRRT